MWKSSILLLHNIQLFKASSCAGWKSLRHPPNVPPKSYRSLSCYVVEKEVQISSYMSHVAEPSGPLPIFSEGAALWDLRNTDPGKQDGLRLVLLRGRMKWNKHSRLKTSSKCSQQFWQQRQAERWALPAHCKHWSWRCSLAAEQSNNLL